MFDHSLKSSCFALLAVLPLGGCTVVFELPTTHGQGTGGSAAPGEVRVNPDAQGGAGNGGLGSGGSESRVSGAAGFIASPAVEARSLCPPQTSTWLQLRANLDARMKIPLSPFDAALAEETTNVGQSFTFFSGEGKAQRLWLYFRRSGQHDWSYYAVVEGESAQVGEGMLTFNSFGLLASFVQSTPIWIDNSSILLDFGVPLSGGGSGSDALTQFASDSVVLWRATDGCPASLPRTVSARSGERCPPCGVQPQQGDFGFVAPFERTARVSDFMLPGATPPLRICPPTSTSKIQINSNLDADATVPTAPFQLESPSSTSNFATSLVIYDTLGDSHSVDVYFRKTGNQNWSYYVLTPGEELSAPVPGYALLGSGDLEFAPSGALLRHLRTNIAVRYRGTNGQEVSVELGRGTDEGGTGLDGVTQFSSPAHVSSQRQNGCATSAASTCPASWCTSW